MRRRTFSALLAAGLLPASSHIRAFSQEIATDIPAPDEETAWVCPMHGDYTMNVPGKCPRCGMDLVHAAPFDVRDYQLDFHTVPAAVKPGQKIKMYFRFLHPGTRAIVTKFEVVHEKQFHLFVISQDMEHFEHIHPVEAPDGTWTIETVLPKAGYYKVLCDFLPSGGSAQFLAQPLVTAGYEGDLEADSAHLVRRHQSQQNSGRHYGESHLRSAGVSDSPLRAHDVLSDRHGLRQADHRSADLSWRFRSHADHERGYGGLRSLAPARHSRFA